MSVCTTQILPFVVAQKSRSAKEETDEATETPSPSASEASVMVGTGVGTGEVQNNEILLHSSAVQFSAHEVLKTWLQLSQCSRQG